MNIVIFQTKNVNPERGGINRMSVTYFDILTKGGHDVWFLSLNKEGTLLPNQLIAEGTTIDEQHQSFHKIISDYQIELMIYQNGISPYQNFILRWAKESGIKIVDIIHNTLRGMYGIGGHPALSNLKPLFVRNMVNKGLNYYFMMKYGKLYSEQFQISDKVVLLSDKFRDEITYFTGWTDSSKFIAITNPQTLKAPIVDVTKKKNIVLNVGLLSAQKRQDLLLKVWQRVHKLRSNWQLIIVGEGPKRQQLEAQSRKLGLRNIFFEGFQKPESYYEDASIFSLTSGYESFGLVLVESMAYGCVPMAFNSFETACDIIDDDINGKLIQPFDIEAYAQQMVWLMDNQEQREEMAQKAIEKSKAFDVDAIGKLWYDLIAEIQGNTKKKY